ncbi:MAG: phosphonate ABC transporter substrate-binding protein [Rhodobacteraceae bacterium]|nr:MAG: phosphonate ABC transporter substrate-binding protein [Paracoccaceae bacterium]
MQFLYALRKMTGLCAIALMLSATTGFADISLVFGTYAADKPTTTIKKFKPFLDYLSADMSARLGEPVTIRIKLAANYSAGIADLTQGNVDFSRFGPASYVSAKKKNPNIEIVAMETKKGEKKFYGIIAVHNDSDITTLAELKGRSFAFGDPLSTIGRYLSQAKLLEAGITGADLQKFSYLGRHDRVGSAVGNKDFDAGALKESTFKKLQDKDTPIKVLLKFENVTKPWITRAGLPTRIFDAMRISMLTASDPEILKTISKTGFLKGHDADYDSIRTAMQESAIFDQ